MLDKINEGYAAGDFGSGYLYQSHMLMMIWPRLFKEMNFHLRKNQVPYSLEYLTTPELSGRDFVVFEGEFKESWLRENARRFFRSPQQLEDFIRIASIKKYAPHLLASVGDVQYWFSRMPLLLIQARGSEILSVQSLKPDLQLADQLFINSGANFNHCIAASALDKNLSDRYFEILAKNTPKNPELWAKAKAAAKKAYKVYPSAYANGFAVKKYNEWGGKWSAD
jgi:hypothetical protein